MKVTWRRFLVDLAEGDGSDGVYLDGGLRVRGDGDSVSGSLEGAGKFRGSPRVEAGRRVTIEG